MRVACVINSGYSRGYHQAICLGSREEQENTNRITSKSGARHLVFFVLTPCLSVSFRGLYWTAVNNNLNHTNTSSAVQVRTFIRFSVQTSRYRMFLTMYYSACVLLLSELINSL